MGWQWQRRRRRLQENCLVSCKVSLNPHTYSTLAGEKATSLILYIYFGQRRTIYFLPYFHDVEFFISTFCQEKFGIAFFLWTTRATPTPRTTFVCDCECFLSSFSCFVFIINEQENWRLESAANILCTNTTSLTIS